MTMSISEADAVQDLLHIVAEQIAQLVAAGHTVDETIVATEDGREIRLAGLILSASLLADKSSARLMAGLDGDRWWQMVDRLAKLGTES